MKKYIRYSVLPLTITFIVLFFSIKTEASKTEKQVEIVPEKNKVETKKPPLIAYYAKENYKK